MYLNVWGAEEVYEQSLNQAETQKQAEQKNNEKQKSLVKSVLNLWSGNSKEEKDPRKN